MKHLHRYAEVRILDASNVAARIRERFETWFVADKDDLVFRSWILETDDINSHLKWLLGMLVHERKFIRQLQSEGVQFVVRVYCERLPIYIEPESLMLPHKLHLPVEIVDRN